MSIITGVMMEDENNPNPNHNKLTLSELIEAIEFTVPFILI